MKKFIVVISLFCFLLGTHAYANRWYGQIIDYSHEERIALFTLILSSDDDVYCSVSDYFIRGVGSKTGTLYIAIECKNGEEYHLGIKDDSSGTSEIVSCRKLRLVTGIYCWDEVGDRSR